MTQTPHASTSGPSHRKDAQRNRDAILAAAREVFAERGLDVSLDVIADRASVGTGTVYRNFANKHDLANAVFDDIVGGIVASTDEVHTTLDAWTSLCDIIVQTLTVQADNRAIREMLLMANQDEWTHHDSLLAPVKAAFTRAKDAGVMRAEVVFSDLVVMIIMLCSLNDYVHDASPQLWRRYLPTMLYSLRSALVPLPETPLSDTALHNALDAGIVWREHALGEGRFDAH